MNHPSIPARRKVNGQRVYGLMAVTSLIASVSVAAAALGISFSGPAAWPVWALLACGSAVITAGTIGLLYERALCDRRAVEKHFREICGIDPRDVAADTTAGDAPPLPEGHPLGAVAKEVRETLLAAYRQVRELDHDHTVSEIRYRRAIDQYERIMNIFSELSEPILVVDGYDELVLSNRSARELLGIGDPEPEARLLSQVIQCRKLVDLVSATRRRKRPGSRADEIELPGPDGRARHFRVTATTLAGDEPDAPGGSSGGAVAVLRDIGDRKALQKRNAEFVSAVSHEMKTPLAGIKAYVELLADGDAEDDQTREEFLEVINSQADRLQRLVENLLNLSRIEAGVVKVSKKQQSLNEVLDEAFHVVQPAAEAKNIRLASELSPMYLGVLADRDMLLQSAINLLSNAIKYTPEGGSVTLRSRLEAGQVRFEVQDTGVGLSEEDRQRVFEKFYRVNKDKNMAPGTGLGLPLAKHIVEDVHGGRLTVESALGEGSTFIVALPGAGQMR